MVERNAHLGVLNERHQQDVQTIYETDQEHEANERGVCDRSQIVIKTRQLGLA